MKTTQVLKAAAIGIITGAALFFFPFPFRFLFIFFLIFFIVRFFVWSRYRNGNWRHHQGFNFWNPSYTQRWQNMSDEERKAFINKMESELFTSKPVPE